MKHGETWYISWMGSSITSWSLILTVPESDILAASDSVRDDIDTRMSVQVAVFGVLVIVSIAVLYVCTISSSETFA
jgi:hypothetical protein